MLILSHPVRLPSEMMSLWRVASAWGRAAHCGDPHGKIMKEMIDAELLASREGPHINVIVARQRTLSQYRRFIWCATCASISRQPRLRGAPLNHNRLRAAVLRSTAPFTDNRRRSQRKSKCLQPILLEQTINSAAAVMPISRNDNSVNAIASQHGPHNDGA